MIETVDINMVEEVIEEAASQLRSIGPVDTQLQLCWGYRKGVPLHFRIRISVLFSGVRHEDDNRVTIDEIVQFKGSQRQLFEGAIYRIASDLQTSIGCQVARYKGGSDG